MFSNDLIRSNIQFLNITKLVTNGMSLKLELR
jgi:hypothetical protein